MSDSKSGNENDPGGKSGNHLLVVDHKSEIKKYVEGFLSNDDVVKIESLAGLKKYGRESIPYLIEEIVKKSQRQFYYDDIISAISEIGKPPNVAFIDALGCINELKKPDDFYLLDSIVEAIKKTKNKEAIVPLCEKLKLLNEKIAQNKDNKLISDLCEATKVRIHFVLSELDWKNELDDLLQMLGDGKKRVRDGIIQTLAKIGDKRALIPLLRLYETEVVISFSISQQIKFAFRDIVKRNKVCSSDEIFKSLTPNEKAQLEKLYPKTKSENGNNHDNNPNPGKN